ncbi:hypothetical protein VZT92_020765 [Zoarces viviparus]|uniref:CCHC-type domain-containing protein n=1 Tax=Zoarces viviparus TaxID=48416 RepID=A0AAW1EF53_ZOAVI
MVTLSTQEMLGRARERMEDETKPRKRGKEWRKMKKYLERWQKNGWFPTVTAPTAENRCKVLREAAKARSDAAADYEGASRMSRYGRKRALDKEDKRCADTGRLLAHWKAADPTTPASAVGLPEVLKVGVTDFKPHRTATTPEPDKPVHTPVYLPLSTEAHGRSELLPPYEKKQRTTNPSLEKPSIQAILCKVRETTRHNNGVYIQTMTLSDVLNVVKQEVREYERYRQKKEEELIQLEDSRKNLQLQTEQRSEEEEKIKKKKRDERFEAMGVLTIKPWRRRTSPSDNDEEMKGASGGRPPLRCYTRKRKEPERYADWFCPVKGEMPPLPRAQQYPLLVKSNGQAEFVPWGHRDMDTLEKALPPLRGGASPWIRLFEKLTAADKLALGDIRAMIIRAEGTIQLKALEARTGTSTRMDHTPFNNFRGVFWESMRSIWPTKPNMNSLTGLKIKPEEEMYQYLKRAAVEWHDATGGRHDSHEATTVVWRHTVQKGLPLPVQTALEGVVGLSNMDDAMWREYLNHHNQRHQTDETSREEDLKKLIQRLLKGQIVEADRERSKKQMAVTEDQPPQQPQYPAAPPAPNRPYPADLAPTVMYHQPPPQSRGRGCGYGRGRGLQQGGCGRHEDEWNCYICGKEGHWAKGCPRKRRGRQSNAPPQRAPFPPRHQQYPRPGPPPLMEPPSATDAVLTNKKHRGSWQQSWLHPLRQRLH